MKEFNYRKEVEDNIDFYRKNIDFNELDWLTHYSDNIIIRFLRSKEVTTIYVDNSLNLVLKIKEEKDFFNSLIEEKKVLNELKALVDKKRFKINLEEKLKLRGIKNNGSSRKKI